MTNYTKDIEENKFNFSVDAYLYKSTGEKIEKEEELDYDNMWVQGIASDDQKDLEGEIMNPRNFYLDYFLEVGKITYEHKSIEDPLTAIGEPRIAQITNNNEFFVKGVLYKSNDLAKKVYKQTFILQTDTNSTRKMQWSVEGKRIVKEGKPVGVLVTHVTLTQNPINYKNTFAEAVKKALHSDIIIDDKLDFDLDPTKEAELMIYLHQKDNTIFSNYKKAVEFCKILDYCSKYDTSLNFFEKNTIDKLNQLSSLKDIRKAFEYCDIAFHIYNSFPASADYFTNNNIIYVCDKITKAL